MSDCLFLDDSRPQDWQACGRQARQPQPEQCSFRHQDGAGAREQTAAAHLPGLGSRQ